MTGLNFTQLKEKYKEKLRQNIWYHATTEDCLESLEKGILVNFNKGKELDFGQGFYLTPDLDMAIRYIESMIKYKKEVAKQFSFSEAELTPVIVEYEFQDCVPADYFENNAYKTTCFPSFSSDFAEFILKNRIESSKQVHDYQLIYGVMSDSNPLVLVPQVKNKFITKDEFIREITSRTMSTRQLSIHSQEICDKLVKKDTHYIKEGVVKYV